MAKALGGAEHGGGMVVQDGSVEHLALSELAERLAEPGEAECVQDLPENPLDFIELDSPRETYRRTAVLFGARLPTPAEEASFDGLDDDQAMDELDRLVDGLNVDSSFRDTYGGADFWNLTTRQRRPNSVMSAVSRRVANEFGCLIAPQEFSVPAADRVLLGAVEPGQTSESHRDRIYQALEDIHRRMLMRDDVSQDELDRAFELFETVQQDGQARVEADEVRDTLEMHCRVTEQALGQEGDFSEVVDDTDFTIRAWMAVLSYMALHRDFLFD